LFFVFFLLGSRTRRS